MIVLALGAAFLCGGQCSAQEYGGSLKYGDTVLQPLIGGSFQVTPDTPITVTAFHPHGLNALWVEVVRLKKERVARSSTGPTTLGGTFTLREKFQITKAGRYSFTARGYQLPVPGATPAKCLGPRPFYFVKATLDVIVPETSSPANLDNKERDGWKSSGPGSGWGSPDWQMTRATFNSGPYRELAVLLINSSNSPLAWFDDIEIEGLKIINAGFEDISGPDQFVGWEGRLWLPWHPKYHALKEPLHMFASPECHGGKSSLQVTAPWKDAFLVRQRVVCKPDTDYTVRCWMRSTGSGRLEIHGLKDNEALENVRSSANVDQAVKPCVDHRLVLLGAPPVRTDLGDTIIEIREPGAKMSKRFVVGSHMPFLVTCDVVVQSSPDRMFYGTTVRNFPYAVPTHAEKASAVVRALDPQGHLLAEVSTDVSTPIALALRLKGFAGASREVVVELTKAGGGVVRFGNVRLGPPDATVAIRSAKWHPREKAFVFPKECAYRLDAAFREKKNPSRLDLGAALELLEEEMRGAVQLRPAEASDTTSLQVTFDERGSDEEDYVLHVDSASVRIAASSARGAFYGLITLMDLVAHEKGEWVLPGCAIEDGPDLPIRWFRGIGTTQSPERGKIMARLKFNGGIPSASDHLIGQTATKPYVRHLDDVLATIKAARSYGIDYVPFIQNTAHAEASELWIDPNVAEGMAVEDEALVLNGEEPTHLKNSNVIQTESSRVELRSADGTPYEEGRDFRIIAEPLKFPFYDSKGRPRTNSPAVARTENSRIPDGGAVLASYDYVARHPHYSRVFSRCLSEPRGKAIVRQYLENVLTLLPPVAYVHLSHDEAMSYFHLVNGKWTTGVTDRRCLRTGRSFEQLFAADVNRLLKEVKALSPKTDVIIWADMMRGPEHSPSGMEILRNLSKEVILLPWYYGRGKHELGAVEGWRDIAAFSRMGFRSIGAPGMFNIENVKGWCQAGYQARKRGWPFMGIMFYAGGGYQGKGAIGIPAAGRFSWRVPEGWTPPDEPRQPPK